MKKSSKLYLVEEDIKDYYELENGWWHYCGMRRDIVTPKGRTRIHAQKARAEPRLCPKCNFV